MIRGTCVRRDREDIVTYFYTKSMSRLSDRRFFPVVALSLCSIFTPPRLDYSLPRLIEVHNADADASTQTV